jgi:uncharacterized protein (DUF3084 family)
MNTELVTTELVISLDKIKRKKEVIKAELQKIERESEGIERRLKLELKEIKSTRKEKERYLAFFRLVLREEEIKVKLEEIRRLRCKEKQYRDIQKQLKNEKRVASEKRTESLSLPVGIRI